MNARDRAHLALRINAVIYDLQNALEWIKGRDAEEGDE